MITILLSDFTFEMTFEPSITINPTTPGTTGELPEIKYFIVFMTSETTGDSGKSFLKNQTKLTTTKKRYSVDRVCKKKKITCQIKMHNKYVAT